jgi:hypothetical protein
MKQPKVKNETKEFSAAVGRALSARKNRSRCRPQLNIYTFSAQPWDYMNPELPKFHKLPKV